MDLTGQRRGGLAHPLKDRNKKVLRLEDAKSSAGLVKPAHSAHHHYGMGKCECNQTYTTFLHVYTFDWEPWQNLEAKSKQTSLSGDSRGRLAGWKGID